MKVLAAHRAGLKTVILPKRNERELDELPDDVRNTMRFVPVEGIEEALEVALLPAERTTEVPEASDDQALLQQRRVSLN